MLKQDLATSYDYNLESCYKNLDDCNFGFIDTSNLKRFLVKCCIYASDALLIAIILKPCYFFYSTNNFKLAMLLAVIKRYDFRMITSKSSVVFHHGLRNCD